MGAALASGALTERYHFHDLRAFAAQRATGPQTLLGHDPASTTKIYLREPAVVVPNE